jgi:transcriptional regulator with XRE-family HTH domain
METYNNNPGPIYLSANLRVLRKRLNLSQEELASRVGLNRGNIASYEKGTAEPKICNLLKFAQVFKVSILDLTRRDLQKETLLATEKERGNGLVRVPGGLHQHISQVDELRTVVKSIYNCHQYHLKNQNGLSQEMKTAATHFHQLHEVTRVLIEKHEQLLNNLRGQ